MVDGAIGLQLQHLPRRVASLPLGVWQVRALVVVTASLSKAGVYRLLSDATRQSHGTHHVVGAVHLPAVVQPLLESREVCAQRREEMGSKGACSGGLDEIDDVKSVPVMW